MSRSSSSRSSRERTSIESSCSWVEPRAWSFWLPLPLVWAISLFAFRASGLLSVWASSAVGARGSRGTNSQRWKSRCCCRLTESSVRRSKRMRKRPVSRAYLVDVWWSWWSSAVGGTGDVVASARGARGGAVVAVADVAAAGRRRTRSRHCAWQTEKNWGQKGGC